MLVILRLALKIYRNHQPMPPTWPSRQASVGGTFGDLIPLAHPGRLRATPLQWQLALVVNNPPANAGDVRNMGSMPGLEDPLKEGMATHSSILA